MRLNLYSKILRIGISSALSISAIFAVCPAWADMQADVEEKYRPAVHLSQRSSGDEASGSQALDHIYIVDSSLMQLLQQFTDHNSMTLNADKSIKGRVRGTHYPLDKKAFMEKIGKDFNLNLFEHSRTLFVTSKSDVSTRILNLGPLLAEDVMSYLEKAQVIFPQFPIKVVSSKKAIFVSGPKVYISLVKSLIEECYNVVLPSNLKVTTFGRKRNVNLGEAEPKPTGLFQ